LLEELQKDLEDKDGRFAFVFLIDDFIASGTTLLREEGGKWKGKLPKFWNDIQPFLATHFEPGWRLCVHHYLMTHRARMTIDERQEQALASRGKEEWFERIQFSYGMLLPEHFPLDEARHAEFLRLTERYYDAAIETRHTGPDIWLGFRQCALPL